MLAGCAWIILSDTALELFTRSFSRYALLQTYKGWVFISVSSILLFILLYRELKKRDIIESDLNDNINGKKVLLNEIHHRVRNNLNMIISLLYIGNSKAMSQDSMDMIETLSGRIYSMALVHEHLYKSENFRLIKLKEYIPQLAAAIAEGHYTGSAEIRINCDIDETAFDITGAIPFGIMINEIISNSFRHAFRDKKRGNMNIAFRPDGGRYILTIADDGTGFDPAECGDSGLTGGIELIRLLVKQMSGEVQINSRNGTEYIISFPARKTDGEKKDIYC